MNITIAGAGVTGLVTAYVLNKAGRNITLYDPDGFPPKTMPATSRVGCRPL